MTQTILHGPVVKFPGREILIAPASFKGTLTPQEVATAMEAGVRKVLPIARITTKPLSDGGEGLVSILADALGATLMQTSVCGPIPGQIVPAVWALTRDRTTAVIEMAAAAGLPLVPPLMRAPAIATTFGVGQLLRAACDIGAKRILIGLGGSATNDGGAGMAQAVGIRLLDAEGMNIPPGGEALARLARIDMSGIDARVCAMEILAACDVTVPLVGPDGATAVFGPQKGVRPEQVTVLDRALIHFSDIVKRERGINIARVPGAGAAGGLGGALLAFFGARLCRGIDLVMDSIGFDEALRGASLVLTGEGKLDDQTRRGKVIDGVVGRARRLGIPVVAVVGVVDPLLQDPLTTCGLEGFATLVNDSTPLESALRDAARFVEERTASLIAEIIAST